MGLFLVSFPLSHSRAGRTSSQAWVSCALLWGLSEKRKILLIKHLAYTTNTEGQSVCGPSKPSVLFIMIPWSLKQGVGWGAVVTWCSSDAGSMWKMVSLVPQFTCVRQVCIHDPGWLGKLGNRGRVRTKTLIKMLSLSLYLSLISVSYSHRRNLFFSFFK